MLKYSSLFGAALLLLALLPLAGCDAADVDEAALANVEATETATTTREADSQNPVSLMPCTSLPVFSDSDSGMGAFGGVSIEANSTIEACVQNLFGVNYYRVDAKVEQKATGISFSQTHFVACETVLDFGGGNQVTAEDVFQQSSIAQLIELDLPILLPVDLAPPGGIKVTRSCKHGAQNNSLFGTTVSGLLP